MVEIKDFLNVRYSTRNLSDEQFEGIVNDLAIQLEKIDYKACYTEEQLKVDWKKLNSWVSKESNINSTSRIGMKLCEHFFPNFYKIEDNRGKSFANSWTAKGVYIGGNTSQPLLTDLYAVAGDDTDNSPATSKWCAVGQYGMI